MSAKLKLSISDKFEIIKKISEGQTRKQVITEYKLKSQSHLTNILKKKNELIQKYNELSDKTSRNSYKIRTSKHPNVEKALIQWIKQMRKKKIHLSVDTILKKAADFAKLFGINDFEPTMGYWNGFKRRNDFLFSKKCRQNISNDFEVIEKWTEDMKTLICDYKPEDVYTLGETALFWRFLPSKKFLSSDETTNGDKKSMDRITVVVITNSDGSDRNCSVIGKSVKPRALRGINNLVIDYYSQNNSYIDSEIYRKILIKLNQNMKKQKKNILLFVNKCKTHSQDIQLSNILVKFFPDNKSEIQPLRNGIINYLKRIYRKELISLMINELENGNEFNIKDINLYKAMDLIHISLESIKKQTIIDCFKNSYFHFNETEDFLIEDITEDNNEYDIWQKLISLTDIKGFATFDDYISIDSNENIESEEYLSDEQIVEKVSNLDVEVIELSDDYIIENKTENRIESISSLQALEYIYGLKKFFEQIGDNSGDQHLYEIQRKIYENTFKSLKQLK